MIPGVAAATLSPSGESRRGRGGRGRGGLRERERDEEGSERERKGEGGADRQTLVQKALSFDFGVRPVMGEDTVNYISRLWSQASQLR